MPWIWVLTFCEFGGSNEPEGVATAPLTTDRGNQQEQSYSFSYDAKSTKRPDCKVSNKEVGAGRLKRHRDKHSANFSLVVAPDYELGALQTECRSNPKVTSHAGQPDPSPNIISLVSAAAGTMDFLGSARYSNCMTPMQLWRMV